MGTPDTGSLRVIEIERTRISTIINKVFPRKVWAAGFSHQL